MALSIIGSALKVPNTDVEQQKERASQEDKILRMKSVVEQFDEEVLK